MKRNFRALSLALCLGAALLFGLIQATDAGQRRGGGSFGGGRSSGGSFGGGRSSSSFGGGRSGGSFSGGGGSFGSGRSSSSFGGSRSYSNSGRSGSSSFGGGRSTTGSGSFGRSGSFGAPSYTTSRSVNYNGRTYPTSSYYYQGRPYHAVYAGGWGDYWYHPAWYYWTPFHPAFYFGGPQYIDGPGGGYYVPGGFSFFRFIIGALFFVFVVWLVAKLFGFGGRKRVKYTNYS